MRGYVRYTESHTALCVDAAMFRGVQAYVEISREGRIVSHLFDTVFSSNWAVQTLI